MYLDKKQPSAIAKESEGKIRDFREPPTLEDQPGKPVAGKRFNLSAIRTIKNIAATKLGTEIPICDTANNAVPSLVRCESPPATAKIEAMTNANSIAIATRGNVTAAEEAISLPKLCPDTYEFPQCRVKRPVIQCQYCQYGGWSKPSFAFKAAKEALLA